MRKETNLEVLKLETSYAVCKAEDDEILKVNFQSIPFEIEEGSNMEAVIYYDEVTNEPSEIIITGKN